MELLVSEQVSSTSISIVQTGAPDTAQSGDKSELPQIFHSLSPVCGVGLARW